MPTAYDLTRMAGILSQSAISTPVKPKKVPPQPTRTPATWKPEPTNVAPAVGVAPARQPTPTPTRQSGTDQQQSETAAEAARIREENRLRREASHRTRGTPKAVLGQDVGVATPKPAVGSPLAQQQNLALRTLLNGVKKSRMQGTR